MDENEVSQRYIDESQHYYLVTREHVWPRQSEELAEVIRDPVSEVEPK